MLTYVPIRKAAKEAVTRFSSTPWANGRSAVGTKDIVGEGNAHPHASSPDFRAPAHASVDRAAPAYGVERERSAGGSHPLPCQRLVREDGNKGTSSSRPSPRTRFHQIHGLCMYYMRMLTSPASITGTGNSSEKTSSGALWSIESQRIRDV